MHRVAVWGMVLSALMGTAALAAWGGPRVPRVTIAAQGEVRPAGLISYEENEPTPEGGCSALIADGFGILRKEVPVTGGRVRARLRVRTADRPDRVRVMVWDEVDEDGFPEGDGHVIRSGLRRQRRGWVVAIRPFVRDLTYGELFLKWRDHDGCGAEEGSWLFLLDPR